MEQNNATDRVAKYEENSLTLMGTVAMLWVT